MDLTLPLDHEDTERILPHRFPFLLVDRVIEFERDKRIVGVTFEPRCRCGASE